MEHFVTSGRAVDVVLAVLLFEAIWLSRKGWAMPEVAALLLPAALMLVALRAALLDAPWYWIVVPLAASFPVHLADIRQRKSRRRSKSDAGNP